MYINTKLDMEKQKCHDSKGYLTLSSILSFPVSSMNIELNELKHIWNQALVMKPNQIIDLFVWFMIILRIYFKLILIFPNIND